MVFGFSWLCLVFLKPVAPIVERRGHGGGCASSLFFSYDVQQMLSLRVPVQMRSIELPATTVGESSRGGSLRRHKGGLWAVHLNSCHHVLLQGGFFKCRF